MGKRLMGGLFGRFVPSVEVQNRTSLVLVLAMNAAPRVVVIT